MGDRHDVHQLVSGNDSLSSIQLLQLVTVEPGAAGVEVDHVQLERATIVTAPHVDTDNGILEVGGDDHLEDSGRAGDGALEVFEEHELVERIVPLHEEDSPWQSSTQIFVPVVWIPADTAHRGALGLRHLAGHAVLLGHELLRYLGHCID